ncbi:AfsR/SARP family transcriptional regulator, partial [Actinoplanes philippinensis]|uniref:AfsR/SARP family transcriptional regulator n=1 Tax=Actinoplanes philippinensis TaxID=35752 RepID=UPI0033D3AC61
MIRFGVLGPVIAEDVPGRPGGPRAGVTAADSPGRAVALKGPMHRAVLGRLLVARRRVVPLDDLVSDLWVSPPDGAVAAVRTFVAALRRAVEPERPARAPATLLTTEGSGYALRCAPDQVDAWRFEQAVAEVRDAGPAEALTRLDEALTWWRGPAYA